MVDFVLIRRMAKELGRLTEAKWRRRDGLFVAEGAKCVLELLKAATPCRYLFANEAWTAENELSGFDIREINVVGGDVLRQLTNLGTTPPVIAYFELPEAVKAPEESYLRDNYAVALDRIQDPGNLGTILRTCDWMGIRYVLASADTVDAFNPKTVQASMGAVASVKVCYTDLKVYLSQLKDVAVYGTYLDGEDIYRTSFASGGILLMGNEGAGISPELEPLVSHRLNIPLIGYGPHAVESLNVSAATAIALSRIVADRR